LFLGNVSFKEKITLLNIETVFAKSLYILIFVLVGYVIRPLWEPIFILKTLGLFAIYLAIRFLAIQLTFFSHYRLREKIFMTFVSPKGIAVAVVAIVLSNMPLAGLPIIIDIILLFILYSIVSSSLFGWAKNWFLKEPKIT